MNHQEYELRVDANFRVASEIMPRARICVRAEFLPRLISEEDPHLLIADLSEPETVGGIPQVNMMLERISRLRTPEGEPLTRERVIRAINQLAVTLGDAGTAWLVPCIAAEKASHHSFVRVSTHLCDTNRFHIHKEIVEPRTANYPDLSRHN